VNWSGLEPREVEATEAAEAYAALEREDAPLVTVLVWPEVAPPDRRTQATGTGATRAVARRPGAVRLGIIGAGEFTRATHIPILRKMADRFPVTAVATRNGLGARTAAREAGAGAFTTDYRELLARDDVDAVLIATRHDQHAELATEALQAGKAVFLEKPAAMDQEQLDAVLAAVDAAGLPFLVGFNRRFSSAARFLRDLRARHAAPPLLLYRVNAGPTGGDDWTLGPEGGGRAVGEACHMVDFLHALAEGPLTGVQASARHDGPAPDGNFSAQFTFADGMIATLVYTTQGASGLAKEHIEAFLGGEVAVVEDFRRGRTWRTGRRGRAVTLDKGHAAEWEAFHQACTGGPVLPIPLDQLRSVAEATFRIRDAAAGAAPSNSP
jgi:predicted dehydrogenase